MNHKHTQIPHFKDTISVFRRSGISRDVHNHCLLALCFLDGRRASDHRCQTLLEITCDACLVYSSHRSVGEVCLNQDRVILTGAVVFAALQSFTAPQVSSRGL